MFKSFESPRTCKTSRISQWLQDVAVRQMMTSPERSFANTKLRSGDPDFSSDASPSCRSTYSKLHSGPGNGRKKPRSSSANAEENVPSSENSLVLPGSKHWLQDSGVASLLSCKEAKICYTSRLTPTANDIRGGNDCTASSCTPEADSDGVRQDIGSSSISSQWKSSKEYCKNNSHVHSSLKSPRISGNKFFKSRDTPKSKQSLLTSYVSTIRSGIKDISKSSRRRKSRSLEKADNRNDDGINSDGEGQAGKSLCVQHQSQRWASNSSSTSALDGPSSVQQGSLKTPLFQCGTEQTRLDLGQSRVAGEPIQCPQCGMVYTPGELSDETFHRRFHDNALGALKFAGWKKENVVLENADGSRILCVESTDPAYAVKKLRALQAVMDDELGAHSDKDLLVRGRKAYLYVSAPQPSQRIEGACIAEPIISAHRLLDDGCGVGVVSDEPVRALCGIYRLWVWGARRRRGVASCLLNAIRMHCIPGRCLSKEEIAFSDPTMQGKLFASKYLETSQFLVYK